MPRKPSSPLLNPDFKAGAVVEISSDDDGFRGSWYTGTIIKRISSNKDKKKNAFLVQYKNLMSDEAGTKPLSETFDLMQLRPLPPREARRDFKSGEDVDAYHNDGWWEGVITEELGDGRFEVFFRASKEQMGFDQSNLRLHREWVNGNWVPPLEQENSEIKSADSATENYKEGTLVEVSSDEDGFQGAWFAATIVRSVGMDKYLTEYQKLRTDDDREFLKEEIDTFHIRPYPPELNMVDGFNLHEEVDALHNDGWWVGVIHKVLKSSKYTVYFKDSNELLEFKHSDLRLHQDWINGKWVIPSQAMKL